MPMKRTPVKGEITPNHTVGPLRPETVFRLHRDFIKPMPPGQRAGTARASVWNVQAVWRESRVRPLVQAQCQRPVRARCSGVASVLRACWSLVHPLYFPCTSPALGTLARTPQSRGSPNRIDSFAQNPTM